MDPNNIGYGIGAVEMIKDGRVNNELGKKLFEWAIREWMIPIDKYLSDQRVPIPDRIWAAAHEFVDYCIIEIEGDTKEDFLFRPWFQFVHRVIRRWYEEKYGAALHRPDDVYLGACEIFGSLFQLRVPAYLWRDGETGKTGWMVLPVDLQAEEDPANWLVNPPNLGALDHETRRHALEEIVIVSGLLRVIHNDLMTVKKPDEISHELANNIASHLMASAERLTKSRKPAFGLACWESHQAVEKALKLLRRQHGGEPQKTHEIMQLFQDVSDSVTGIDEPLLEQMPEQHRIIEMRAGEGSSVDVQEAYRLYRLGLQITAQCTSAMPHGIWMRNAALEFRKPPWT